MAGVLVLCYFFLLEIFSKGAAAVIQTEQTVLAAVGDHACLTCQLTEYKEVVQFTWQKILPDGEKNLATHTKAFGQRVSPDLKRKMDFHCTDLQNCSVVIRKVTEQDEGCYRCLFNTYPQGAVIGTTCLRLYELHEPVLQVRGSKSPEESVVSCSATGRPAPTVTLTVPQQHLHLSQYNTVTVTNTNNTVTVTTTAVLSGLHDDSTQVGCKARVDSGPQVEVVKRITELRQTTSGDGFHEKLSSNEQTSDFIWIVVVVLVVIFMIFISMCAFVLYTRKKNSDPEKIKTPHKPLQDEPEIKTALVHQENETIRLRPSSSKKLPENNRSKSSTFIPKQLFGAESDVSDEAHQKKRST